ncbi:MAG: NnrS family protein [Steroidobacteraceae bacterium]
MSSNDTMASPGIPLLAAPHRSLFFAGLLSLLLASAWWGTHLVARYTGAPLFALALQPAPLWAHAWLMLFAVFPTIFFGFLFTVFPRWMNGAPVRPLEYVTTATLLSSGTVLWLAGTFTGPTLLLAGCVATGAGLLLGAVALLRVLLGAAQVVPHAVVVLIALCVQVVALGGFTAGVLQQDDFMLHFAVRTSLWGGLLPVFFAVCHRMIPFFSQGVIKDYVPWRPTWILVLVVALCYARLAVGVIGWLNALPWIDAALVALTVTCAVRWSSLQARGNPLLWTLYAGFAWLPLAVLLQLARDGAFVLTGEWALGRAPVHALGMGFFGSMLLAMVTRVTLGHSGQPLRMDRVTQACFVALQLATVNRVLGEIVTSPPAVQWFLLVSLGLWLAAVAVWVGRVAGIYLRPRVDGRPG